MDHGNRMRNALRRLVASLGTKDPRLGTTRRRRYSPNLNAARRTDPVTKSVETPSTSKGDDKPKNVGKINELPVKAVNEINNSENSMEDVQISPPTYTSAKDFVNELLRSDSNDDDDGELQAIDTRSKEIKENTHKPWNIVERPLKKQKLEEVLPQEDTKKTIFTDKATTENPTHYLIKFPPEFDMKNIPTGEIGKIQVHEPGEKQLVVKDLKMKLTAQEEGSSKEIVITVTGNTNSVTSSIVELGEISQRFIATPIWNDLLKKTGDNN